MGILDSISDFFGRSSIPGVSRIAEFKSSCGRVIWLSVIFFSFIGFAIHLGLNTARYLEHAIVTQTILNHEPFIFPDVTVCTQFPLSYARVKAKKQMPGGYSSAGNDFVYAIKDFWKSAQNLTNLGSYTRFDNVESRNSLDRFVEEFDLAHERDEMIIECVYKDRNCMVENFKEFIHPLYQKCQTFRASDRVPVDNGPHDGLQLLISTTDRRAYLTDEEILFWLRGISVRIHQPGTAPVMASKNIIIASGSHSHMSLEMNKYEKIQRDSNPCVSEPEKQRTDLVWLDYLSAIKHEWPVDYSQESCRNLEMQKWIVDKCGCLSEEYFVSKEIIDGYRDSNGGASLKYCHWVDPDFITKPLRYFNDSTTNKVMVQFGSQPTVDNSNEKFGSKFGVNNSTVPFWEWMPEKTREIVQKHHCSVDIKHNSPAEEISELEAQISKRCPPRCTQYTYLPSVTPYQWPETVRNAKAALTKILSKPPTTMKHPETYLAAINTSISDLDILRNSFLKVDMYPADVKGTFISETYAYPGDAYASDVGGVLGLWAGMSIITFIEIFSSCADVFRRKKKVMDLNGV